MFFDAQNFASFYFKIEVLQCPNIIAFAFGAAVISIANFEIRIFFTPYLLPPAVQVVTEHASSYLSEAYCLEMFSALRIMSFKGRLWVVGYGIWEILNLLSSKPIFNFNIVQILKIRYIISH